MLAAVRTLAFNGVNVVDVEVQTLIAPAGNQPSFMIVGLPDKIIAESRERVKAALSSIALDLPFKRITINLSPADLTKEGSHFDLPIALCLLAGLGLIPEDELKKYLILGELSLDGNILPVNGILPAAMGAVARDLGIICPEANAAEATWSGNELILAPPHLLSLINHFRGTQRLARPETVKPIDSATRYPDMRDVIGQEVAKRAIEIAASGNHNMLMMGSPGSGKSMLASRLPGLLPTMTTEEILETSMVYSIAGEIKNGMLKSERPFRSPHQSSSMVALVGGGHSRRIGPGEISLAHNGVLFLDEFPEFPRTVIEAIRQPLETKQITVARANAHVSYPANFQLIAAMNHCKCGYFKNPNKSCSRAPRCAVDYQNKISAPILDRIDIFIEVDEVSKYTMAPNGESTAEIAKRVHRARALQAERYKAHGILTNSQLEGELLYRVAMPSAEGQALLNKFAEKHQISMRTYSKVLKLARTIADLESSEQVHKHHIAEALSYKAQSFEQV
jgi:magnesium chelatase family protein